MSTSLASGSRRSSCTSRGAGGGHHQHHHHQHHHHHHHHQQAQLIASGSNPTSAGISLLSALASFDNYDGDDDDQNAMEMQDLWPQRASGIGTQRNGPVKHIHGGKCFHSTVPRKDGLFMPPFLTLCKGQKGRLIQLQEATCHVQKSSGGKQAGLAFEACELHCCFTLLDMTG